MATEMRRQQIKLGLCGRRKGEKESALSHSTRSPQEHRSWNMSGKILTEGRTETEETKIYSNAAAIWHSYRELSKLRPTRLSSNSQEASVPAVLVK